MEFRQHMSFRRALKITCLRNWDRLLQQTNNLFFTQRAHTSLTNNGNSYLHMSLNRPPLLPVCAYDTDKITAASLNQQKHLDIPDAVIKKGYYVLADFPHTHVIPWRVQWGDQDSFNHVNNCTYIRYYDHLRTVFFEKVLGLSLAVLPEKDGYFSGDSKEHKLAMVVSHIFSQYKRALKFPDELLFCIKVDRIILDSRRREAGADSSRFRDEVILKQAVFSRALGAFAAEGISTVVPFDGKSQRRAPLPDRSIQQLLASCGSCDQKEIQTTGSTDTPIDLFAHPAVHFTAPAPKKSPAIVKISTNEGEDRYSRAHNHLLQAGYRVQIPWQVMFADMNAGAHVSNVEFIRYFEHVRVHYMERVGINCENQRHDEGSATKNGFRVGPILKSIDCDYRRPLFYPDELILCAQVELDPNFADAAETSQTSTVQELVIKHAVYSYHWNDIIAEGNGVIVAYDYLSCKRATLPIAWVKNICKLEKSVQS